MIITVQIEDIAISVVTEEETTSRAITEVKNQALDLWRKVRYEQEELDNSHEIN